MLTSDYNKIVSTINSASRDYNYSPDPNNLIYIDTSNNRIGINTIDPACSLHISGGHIRVNTIYSASIHANNYNYMRFESYNDFLDDSIRITSVDASNVNSSIINVANTLDISKGRIKANYVDISSILDISRGIINSNHINSTTIDISNTLDISQGNIISNNITTFTIDISSKLDISQGHIEAKTIDVSVITISSLLDINQGHIEAKTIDASSIVLSGLLDISQGHIEAKTIDVSTITISSLLTSESAITISSLLDISRGTILADTISGSAITINANANAVSSGDIVNININNTNIRGINIITSLNCDAITINNDRVATTRHLYNAFPNGVIAAYDSYNLPDGWELCDGGGYPPNVRPDLRSRFILNNGLAGRDFNTSGGEESVTLTDKTTPYHTHGDVLQAITWDIRERYSDNFDQRRTSNSYSHVAGVISGVSLPSAYVTSERTSSGARGDGPTQSHENMPPFYVLVYMIKTSNNFRY